ncbi:hypothetical protein PF008_g16597 [Phytophthora fragariae]|uniref:Uncharacterized protein n=1 Tax=Phytophthora fragariae TaxID=53985 RepID=A0A6G0RB71_9STRA|nr:hypothetical protein PF008_g16597 [Phytophthora fragariae]
MIHGLKWLHNASAPVIEARNVCFLEAMEVERDANDEKFGFLVLHSLFFSCIFRDAAPGVVDVVLRGIFHTSGELRRWGRACSRVKLRWCRVCGIAVCSKCRVIGFLEVEYAVVADYFMESFWESEPQAEVATLFTIPLQWAGPLKEPIAAFCDWKQHRPGPVAAQNWNSSLN